jgi:uncharacterized membrane protein
LLLKALRTILAILATIVGLYPLLYLFVDMRAGLLDTKSATVLSSTTWNIGFYTHILSAGIALLLGWTQFNNSLRRSRLRLHRTIGKIYIGTAFLASASGIYIAFYATGGIIASLGFMLLGLVWFYTTLRAYTAIRHKDINHHRAMMTYSYAACLAAVTLRIYLPILTILLHDFENAYITVAWLSWIPNLAVAFYIVSKPRRKAV